MSAKRFPVAGTDPPLTIPWEVAEQAGKAMCAGLRLTKWQAKPLIDELKRQGITVRWLDTWYGKHWREVAR